MDGRRPEDRARASRRVGDPSSARDNCPVSSPCSSEWWSAFEGSQTFAGNAANDRFRSQLPFARSESNDGSQSAADIHPSEPDITSSPLSARSGPKRPVPTDDFRLLPFTRVALLNDANWPGSRHVGSVGRPRSPRCSRAVSSRRAECSVRSNYCFDFDFAFATFPDSTGAAKDKPPRKNFR
jgi:hypothetical protein